MFVLGVLVAVGYALFRRLVWRYPRRPTLSRDGADHPAADRRRGPHRVARRGASASPRYGDPDAGWAVAANPLALRPAAVSAASRAAGRLRASSSGRTSRWSASSWSTCRARSTSTSSRRSSTPRCASCKPRGELPAMDLEARDAALRRQDHRGPVVEGPARRLHVHRVRPLPGRVPGLGDGQAAQPQDDDHGHPRDVGRGGGRRAAHPVDQARRRDRRRPRHRHARSSTPPSRTTRSGTASPAAPASRRAR